MVVEADGMARDHRDTEDLMATGPFELVTPAPK